MTFTTVLHNLTSPVNVGTIVRSHVAFGGDHVVFVGLDRPWGFKKNTQAFSRRLERLCSIVYLDDDEQLFAWCAEHGYTPVAIEISESATPLPGARFPERPAIVVGHEGRGLSESFMQRCAATLVIPQFGDVACLNVGISAALAMYELRRAQPASVSIAGNKFWVDPQRRVSM